ncbi:hypothetical protein [Streptomyces sp. ISL-100]|uniref:hypothetical protein n=1 Tax=Streptomyces sp. ISL-100 TaxID=2819173 RepID=UPI001BED10C9|nr:hypothetical protein [Streptomyces sp. ISL-100]MBT2394954.1 hypothetical protein [Streptomyces sp. ISL-100]
MSEKESREPDREPRPRTEKGPGAHSGAERQAQERVVPGTASAREGYRTKGGTAGGESLEGVESSGEERGAQRSAKGDVTHTPARRKRHK